MLFTMFKLFAVVALDRKYQHFPSLVIRQTYIVRKCDIALLNILLNIRVRVNTENI